MLFELSHENTGLEALHFHRKAKQFNVRLPLALSKLSKQTVQTNNKKTESNENVFKVERCGSSLLTSNRKLNLEKTVDF
jgi:hypothetical protein